MKDPRASWAPGSVMLASIPFEQATRTFAHRDGGTKPLAVAERIPGVFASAWIVNKAARRIIKRPHALTLVIDTNVPGHPSVSLLVQPVDLLSDSGEITKTPLPGQDFQRAQELLREAMKTIVLECRVDWGEFIAVTMAAVSATITEAVDIDRLLADDGAEFIKFALAQFESMLREDFAGRIAHERGKKK
jgi:hypothetical protein